MNQQKLMLCSILVSLMVISCKKDKTTEANPVIAESTNYKFQLPLAIGNYWVYQTDEVDSNGIAVPYGILDSCYVAGDTLIGNKTYFKLYWKPLVFQSTVSCLRDSGGYNVDQYGNIFNQDFTIGDTISVSYDSALYFTRYYIFAQPPVAFTTPAGSFNNLKMKEQKIVFDSLPYSPFSPLILNQIEANGVGEIFDEITYTSFIPLKKKYERRLIRYHLL